MASLLSIALLSFPPLFALQVLVGKEREAVTDMLPYLRLGYVSDPADMHSVITSQGPVCPVSLLYLYYVGVWWQPFHFSEAHA